MPRLLAAALAFAVCCAVGQQRIADYIVAVVNQELVTNAEIEQRLQQVRANAQRNGATLPPPAELREQIVQTLVDERVLITHARDSGLRVDDGDVDRAVANIAAQNQLTLPQLREQLQRNGIDMSRLRANLRDQLLVERVREREVGSRIRVSDVEIDAMVDKLRGRAADRTELNIAQILVPVPEGASVAEAAERRARIDAAAARIRAGEPFEQVAREVSEDANKAAGGVIGLKPADRLPDLFVEGVRNLAPGEVAREPLRSGAGFHLLKLIERKQAGGFTTQQTRARHILLRPSPQLSAQAAAARLADFKRQVESGARSFEALAREHSEDGSAAQGGDLGWTSPGSFVPEFERAMNELPVGGISAPVSSRFGLHLIQVMERREVALDPKQLREQARAALREQKFEQAYNDWVRDLRSRAYVEVRDAPQ